MTTQCARRKHLNKTHGELALEPRHAALQRATGISVHVVLRTTHPDEAGALHQAVTELWMRA